MRAMYKLTAAAAVLSLLCGCVDITPLLMHNEIEQPVEPVKNAMPSVTCIADELHEELWYSDVCEHLKAGETLFHIDEMIANREMKKALVQIEIDYPEIFWLGGRYYAKTRSGGSEVSVDFLEDIDTEKIPEMLTELEAAADKAIAGIPAGSGDYEKALYIHDYLIDNTVYDHKGAASDEFGMWGSSYGCLVEGKAVCEGYAEAFVYIMKKLGIESGICTGSNHAWNYVNIDGSYYWIDVTWDDVDDDSPHAQHTYFMFTDDQLLNTRTFDMIQGYVPKCDTMTENYFVKNGGYFETYDEDKVLDHIGSCSDNKNCEIMFADYETYKEALNSLLGDMKLTKADGVSMKSVQYYRNDQMFTLDIIF